MNGAAHLPKVRQFRIRFVKSTYLCVYVVLFCLRHHWSAIVETLNLIRFHRAGPIAEGELAQFWRINLMLNKLCLTLAVVEAAGFGQSGDRPGWYTDRDIGTVSTVAARLA